MRLGEHLVREDWRIAYEICPEAIFTVKRDRRLDRVLARGLSADRPSQFWPSSTWTLFVRIGIVFWAATAAISTALIAGWITTSGPQRGMLMGILMAPAVQCTSAGFIGPGLTRMLQLREAAREAHQRLCEQHGHVGTVAAAGPWMDTEDFTDTVPIPLPELRAAPRPVGERRLHLVEERLH